MSSGFPKTCCICGRTLPTKYAVAGVCSDGHGCEAAFCALHWYNGNRRCPEHGWNPGGLLSPEEAAPAPASDSAPPSPQPEPVMQPVVPDPPSSASLTPAQKLGAVRNALAAISRLGSGVAGIVKKLSGVRDPQEMIDSFETSLAENRTRRAPIRARYDALYREISSKKKEWQAAPGARRRVLELELQSLLSEYRGLERQLAALLENERTLVAVRTRVEEVVAIELRKISEKEIDRITDRLDEAVSGAEDVKDAIRDLEGAGKRRDRESDAESLADALAAFDTPSEDVETHAESAETAEMKSHAEFAEAAGAKSHAEFAEASPAGRAPSRPVPDTPAVGVRGDSAGPESPLPG